MIWLIYDMHVRSRVRNNLCFGKLDILVGLIHFYILCEILRDFIWWGDYLVWFKCANFGIPINTSTANLSIKWYALNWSLQWRNNERGGVSNRRHSIVRSAVSGADQIKHQSFASLAFVRGFHRWVVDSSKKRSNNAENDSIWWHYHAP